MESALHLPLASSVSKRSLLMAHHEGCERGIHEHARGCQRCELPEGKLEYLLMK